MPLFRLSQGNRVLKSNGSSTVIPAKAGIQNIPNTATY